MTRFRKPSPALIVAIAALVFAMTGTGLAASNYLITSTTQIKPSVISALRGEPLGSLAAVSPAKKGGHILRALVHSTGVGGAVTKQRVRARAARLRSAHAHAATIGGGRALVLADNEWTEYSEELNEDAGDVTAAFTQEPNCFQQLKVYLYIENEAGEVVELAEAETLTQPGEPAERSVAIDGENGATIWQYPRPAQQTWKVTGEVVERPPRLTEESRVTEKECLTTPPPPKVSAFLYVIGAR